MSFTSLGLSTAIQKTLADHQFMKPYPIQQKVIPAVIQGKDVLGIAKTGSGKTASYVLPILTNLQSAVPKKNRFVNTLVLVPTRELAIQVSEVFKQFSAALTKNIKSFAVYGGVSINPQMKGLIGVDVLVATPGRLLELVESNAVHLSDIDTLVLDEADKMLNLGFQEEVDRIFALLPKKRQNLLFSATLSEKIETMNRVLLQEPQVVKIEEEKEAIDLINQLGYFVPEHKKRTVVASSHKA